MRKQGGCNWENFEEQTGKGEKESFYLNFKKYFKNSDFIHGLIVLKILRLLYVFTNSLGQSAITREVTYNFTFIIY